MNSFITKKPQQMCMMIANNVQSMGNGHLNFECKQKSQHITVMSLLIKCPKTSVTNIREQLISNSYEE